jgi:hypothetical protein
MLIAGYHERRARLGSFSAHREPRASRCRMDNHPENRVPRAVRTTPSRWHTEPRWTDVSALLPLAAAHVAFCSIVAAAYSLLLANDHPRACLIIDVGSSGFGVVCVAPSATHRRARLWPKPLSGGRAARMPMTVAMAPAAAATGGRTAARMSRDRMPPLDQSRSSVTLIVLFMPLGPQLYLASVTAQGAAVLTQYFVLAC